MNVVAEVRKMARKRVMPAIRTARSSGSPSARLRLMKSTSTRLSFTTTPESATMPSSEKNTRSQPMMK